MILNNAKIEYEELLESGFFWEFYPELTGDWTLDKEKWENVIYPDLQKTREEFKNQADDLRN